MANIRQYIGARYVFKIYENSTDPSSAEWEAGAAYEPLTIVTYLNSSYASKKDVPASVGNPAANPDYWVVTGAYNGQIASLQQQIDDLNAGVSALDDRLDTAESNIIDLYKHPFYDVQKNHVAGASYAQEINDAVNTYDFIVFPKGLYEIDEPIKIIKNVTILMHGDAELRATVAMPYMIGINPDNLPDSALQPEPSYTIQGNIFIKPMIIGGFINCNNLAERGLVINTFYHSVIRDMVIVYFTKIGIVTGYNNGRAGGKSGLNNVTLRGSKADAGVELNGNDDSITGCTVINCKTGYRLYGGNMRIQDSSAWLAYNMEDIYEQSIGIDTKSNVSNIIVDNFAIDTTHVGVSLKSNTIVSANNITSVFNKDVIDPEAYTTPSLFDIPNETNSLINNRSISNVHDGYDFPHYFINCNVANRLPLGLQLSNIDFIYGINYVLDFYIHVIPTLFRSNSEHIDSKLVKLGATQTMLYFKIISDITLTRHQDVNGELFDHTVFTTPQTILPVTFYDTSNNALSGVVLRMINNQITLYNGSENTVTVHKGEYIGYYNTLGTMT